MLRDALAELPPRCLELIHALFFQEPSIPYEQLAKKLDSAVDRGIRLTIITEPLQKVPEGAQVFWKKGLLATTIISDAERALLASPDLQASGYTDNANLAKYLESFLQILMEHSPPKA